MRYTLQKSSMWKRVSAFLFDAILLCILAVMIAWGMSALLGYDRYQATLADAYARYSEAYQIDMNMSTAEFEAMDEAALARLEEANAALAADADAVYAYNMVIQLTVLITCLSILLGFLVLEFAVPLLFGNGQTLGKKVFGIAVMHEEGIRITPVMLFIRTVLGKYAVETMLPLMLAVLFLMGTMPLPALVILLCLGAVQIALPIITRTNALIHDKLACTAAVDMASQMIFNTHEELMAYKAKVHAEKVAQQRF